MRIALIASVVLCFAGCAGESLPTTFDSPVPENSAAAGGSAGSPDAGASTEELPVEPGAPDQACTNGTLLLRQNAAADPDELRAELGAMTLTTAFLGQWISSDPFALRLDTSRWPEGYYSWLTLTQPAGTVRGWTHSWSIKVDRTPPFVVPERTTQGTTNRAGQFSVGVSEWIGATRAPRFDVSVDGVSVPVVRSSPYPDWKHPSPDQYSYSVFSELRPGSVIRAKQLDPISDCAGNKLENIELEYTVPGCATPPSGWTAEDCELLRTAGENAMRTNNLLARGPGDGLLLVSSHGAYPTYDLVPGLQNELITRSRAADGSWSTISNLPSPQTISGVWSARSPTLFLDASGTVLVVSDGTSRTVWGVSAAGFDEVLGNVGVMGGYAGLKFAQWNGTTFVPFSAVISPSDQHSFGDVQLVASGTGRLLASWKTNDVLSGAIYEGGTITSWTAPTSLWAPTLGFTRDGTAALMGFSGGVAKFYLWSATGWQEQPADGCGAEADCQVRRIFSDRDELWAEVRTADGDELRSWDGAKFITRSPPIEKDFHSELVRVNGRIFTVLRGAILSAPIGPR